MADWSNDIEKYQKGELSPSQMHALEKKALSDPFLADALEGLDEISSEDFFNDINELNTRINTTRKKVLLTPLRIAAGIFLIVGVSSVMYFLSNNAPVEQLAEQIQPDATSPPKMDDQKDSLSKPDGNLLSLNEPHKKEEQDLTAVKQQPTAAIKSSELKKDNDKASASERLLLAEEKSDDAEIKTEEEIAPALKEDAKIADAQVARSLQKESFSEKKKSTADERELSRAKNLAAPSVSASQSQNNQFVAGQVTSSDDGSPLPGVNVVVKGTNEGAITDAYGNFSIALPDQKRNQLVFSSIGMQSTEVSMSDQPTINVKMTTDANQLSEVVVTNMLQGRVAGISVAKGEYKKGSDSSAFSSLAFAEPKNGKRAFKKYLESNQKYPVAAIENKIEGRVTIEFTVKTDGMLTNFTVVKGIGYGCDEEVIHLIKEGPTWTPSKEDDIAIESQVKVNLRFRLPRK